ncbi:D-alanyl-D-alanine carboxypeptidase family protein [Bacillota bacterium LX-D]|nr:D-alanyl-D-alanine carboxypeptidase family protein [Bacillota bacterium LX-D]
MKKNIAIFLVLTMVLTICPLSMKTAFAEEPKINAEGAIVIDADSGQILFEQNADKRWYPASTTKIMTLCLALEAVKKGQVKLTDIVPASENACSYGGTQVYLDPRDQFNLNQMLIGIAVGSANDASVAVAEFLGGTEENFAELMNKKAKEIGATNTNFVNSHGLHNDNHYTTPRDLAKITRYSLQHTDLLNYTKIKHYTFREQPKLLILNNTNKLLWRYPGTDGIKTGTTSQAKRNLVSTVEKDGLRLIAVVMGVDEKGGHFSESIKLYNWAFSQFGYKQLYGQGQVLTQVKVSKGSIEELPLVAEQKVGAFVIKGKEAAITTKIIVPKSIVAPIKKNQKVGEILIYKNGQKVSTVNLLAKDEVTRCSLWQQFYRMFNLIVK